MIEEKQLLLNDLCARLPYGVKILQGGVIIETLQSICKVGDDEYTVNALTNDMYNGFLIEQVKPYLRPMSSMTEEEKRQFDDFCVIDEFAWNGNAEIGYKNQAIIMSDAVDWLNAHHFDYRGLIEKGLALEAPEGMYN